MNNFYSPSLNTFFLSEFMSRYKVAGTLPDDVIEVSNEIFIEYTSEPPDGMMRMADEDGYPAWSKLPYSTD